MNSKLTAVKPNAWYYSYVKSLVVRKASNGMTAVTFQPDGLLTRAQISKIIWFLQAV